jgi:hypothetical protein
LIKEKEIQGKSRENKTKKKKIKMEELRKKPMYVDRKEA